MFKSITNAIGTAASATVDGVRTVTTTVTDTVTDTYRDRKALRRVKHSFREQMLAAGHAILDAEEAEKEAQKALEEEIRQANEEAALLHGQEISREELLALLGVNNCKTIEV